MNTRRGALVFSIPFLTGMLVIFWIVLLGTLRPLVANATVIDAAVVNAAGVEIIPDSQSKSGNPGQAVIYTHTVTNSGEIQDIIALAVSSNKGWTVSVNPSALDIAPDASGNVTVTVNVPAGTAAGVKDITTLTATSGSNINAKDTATDTTTVNAEAEVSVSPDSLSKEGGPGQTIIFSHSVTNDGNQSDIVNLSASSSRGWSVSVSPSQLTLVSGASGTAQVTVRIPPKAATGTKDVTTLTATSTNNAAVKDTALDTTTVSDHLLFLPLVVSAPSWGEVGSSTWADGDTARALDVCSDLTTTIFAAATDAGGANGLRLFNGSAWQTPNTTIPADKTITSLAANTVCDTLYVGTYGNGVWVGTKGIKDIWTWSQLGSGTAVPSVRALALSGGVLFAGGDFGLRYWDGANWQPTSGIPSGVIMDLAVGETAQNQGPVYAIQWLNPRIYVNSDPAGNPGQWAEVSGIGDLPSTTVLAVAGTGSSVRFVGTQTVHLSLVGNIWQTVQNRPGRSFAIDGPVAYAGYGDGSGIYKSADGGLTFQPANDGFGTIPEIVYELIVQGENLYAATSEGVFVR